MRFIIPLTKNPFDTRSNKDNLHRNMQYDALWTMNLMNGFLIRFPNKDLGAKMYRTAQSGASSPMPMIIIILYAICWRRNPGNPSYQIEASNCWQWACATNYKTENDENQSGYAMPHDPKSDWVIKLHIIVKYVSCM